MRDYISIATTRPETMLGDGAVAVHPSDARYAPIVGKLCEIPVGPKQHRRLIPIITDEYPDPNFGSGAVKITGAHDFNDYAVAKRAGIPCYRLMDTRAQMRADGAPYAEAAQIAVAVARGERALTEAEVDTINLVPDDLRGLDRFEARKRVVAQITAEGLAVMVPNPKATAESEPALIPLVDAKPIMQPFGDRSKTVIEPMLTDQWFVETARIVQPALDAVRDGRTKITPPSGEKTYYHWLENIEPWCISRQLWWGHQIPVWYGPKVAGDGSAFILGEIEEFCGADEREALAKARVYYGERARIRINDELSELTATARLEHYRNYHPSFRVVGGPLEVELFRDPDVLDTWFSSGLWPIGTLGWPEPTPELKKYFPTSVLITGSDILFFWVARMMMMQLAVLTDRPMEERIPFHTVYLHGLVRDAKGKKMSKSLGNVVDPLDLIDDFGADALRFASAAMANLGGVLKLDTSRIAGYRNFGTKLWNATRFAEMNGVFDAPAGRPAPAHTVNRWIIGETARTRVAVDEALENFRFNDAANTLYAFVWGKVCDWYVEFAKPLFDGDHAGETRQTMRWVLDQCFLMLHPFMPFITEDLWAMTGQRAKMLVHGDWPEYGADLIDPQADREMNWVISLIEEIRSARSQMGVPVAAKIPMLTLEADEAARAALAHNEALILRLGRIEGIADGTAPKGAVSLAVAGAAFALPLAGIIDVAGEQARLTKSLDKLEKDMGGLRGRLNNPKFVASAPEEIVEENRALLAAGEAEGAKIRAALARLADMG